MNTYLKQDEFETVFKRHIKTNVYSLSIKTLFGERMTRKIDYHPYYQRNYVWDNNKASFFIESILLGTDVPPLIFFNTGSKVEVIDGRQRYETIKNFINGDLRLNYNGLTKLTQLKGSSFIKISSDLKDLFNDAKIRIFEFEVINEPKMDSILEDKIKKEIFRRYNSGITPLNTAEIDNATYDDDDITNEFKERLSENSYIADDVKKYFIGPKGENRDNSVVLQFLRKYLVLSSFPINTYATGNNRTEILDLLYNVKSSNVESAEETCSKLFSDLLITIDLIGRLNDSHNKQVNESLLWGITVLSEEGKDFSLLSRDDSVDRINKYIAENEGDFSSDISHHYASIIKRHRSISVILGSIFSFDFSLYIKDDQFKNRLESYQQTETDTKLKLDELKSLRVQKPEPSLVPIEEIVNELSGSRYLLRPSYQRQEKINVFKSSAIIESIILSINLPPLFIYKNNDGIREVIDGQQRLLSILGFLGKQYIDEKGEICYPKNHNFKLKHLKILKEYNGKRYSDLEFSIKDKILDFKVSVIEIDYALNSNFDPVDLFIRLNNKPYPIKENSFEMWNSFADKDVIQKIKEVVNESVDWFYIKKRNRSDRMLNEELITFLSYIQYNSTFRSKFSSITFYKRDTKVGCRLTNKRDVSVLLEKLSSDIELKTKFIYCIDKTRGRIDILKKMLSGSDLVDSLNQLLCKDNNRRYLVDFYTLFQILDKLDDRQLDEISYEGLRGKVMKIREKLNSPSSFDNVDVDEYFKAFLDGMFDC